MNALSIFQYINEQRGKPIPLVVKIIHGVECSKDELNQPNTNLKFPKNTKQPIVLPDGLKCATLDLMGCDINELPKNLYVDQWMDIRRTNITTLPKCLKMGERNMLHGNNDVIMFNDEEGWGRTHSLKHIRKEKIKINGSKYPYSFTFYPS
jgi:hypothetical protein